MSMIKLLKPGDTFSVLNLLFGIISMIFVLHGDFRLALIFILLSLLSDGADGLIARRLGNGKLGENLDSIADFSSFSISPSLLTISIHQDFIIIPFILLYVACSALRLSSFYMFKRRKVFVGMPTPAAGVTIAISSTVFQNAWFVIAIMFTLSLLMVSSIPYPKQDRTIGVTASVIIVLYIISSFLPNERMHIFSSYLLLISCLAYLTFGLLYVKYRS